MASRTPRPLHSLPAHTLTLLALLGCALASSGRVQAQAVDYGALEQLFGEAVTTSATGSPQRITDVPVTMEIVTADDIRRSGANNIPDILSHVAGIDVLQWTNDEADVGVRGYDSVWSPRLLVLIDGRQVYADFYGFTPWSTLPVELAAIRQIEIVKGPNSALFGFNAVDGVINIITYNPLYDDVHSASVTAGTQHLAQGSAVDTIKLSDRMAWRISAGARHDDDFSTPIPPGSLGAPRLGDRRYAMDADGVIRLSNSMQLELDASHTQADEIEMGPTYTLSYMRFIANSIMAKFSADTGGGLLQATAYTNWLKAWNWDGPGTSNDLFGNQTSVLRVQDAFKLGRASTVRLGLEGRHNTAPTAPVVGGRVYYDVLSPSAMWDWAATRALTLTAALRWDYLWLGREGFLPANYPLDNAAWDRNYGEWSFNTGVVYRATADDTLRLSVARGVQLPSLEDFGAFLNEQPPVTGLPTTLPTVVTNYELGWDRTLQAIAGQLRVSVFHQRSSTLRSPLGGMISADGATSYFASSNIGDSDMDGVGLSLGGHYATDWRWGLSYRYENIRDQFALFAQGGSAFVDYEDTTAAHVLKGRLGWSHGRWELDGFADYQSATYGVTPAIDAFGTTLVRIPAYVALDGRVAFKPTGWSTVALSGQNLLHAEQRQTSGPAVGRRVLATLTVSF